MKRKTKRLFDYEIVGAYYDRVPQTNGTTTRIKKYVKKWFFVPLREYRKRKNGGTA